MAKDAQGTVRSHSQEREWLLSLGDGNIVAGVRSLIQQAKGESTASDDSLKEKDKKRKK
jgi:hypothetical protein